MRSRPAVFIEADEPPLMNKPDPAPRVSADRELKIFAILE
jgi:hypothetical protein